MSAVPPNKHRIESPAARRAALYIRVSTEEQAMHGLSLAAQLKAAQEEAAKHPVDPQGQEVAEQS